MKRRRNEVERNFRSILIPVVYACLAAAVSLVGYGLYKPEDVIPNLEGYLALLAILSAPATLAISEINRLYAENMSAKIQLEPDIIKHEIKREQDQQKHEIALDAEERRDRLGGSGEE